jgi:hypothetical protein
MNVFTIPMVVSTFIFAKGVPGTAARTNLKNVIEIQYTELYKVACYFLLKFHNTA